jgi:hypothetical protein
MSVQLSLGNNLNKFLVYAIAVVTLTILPAPIVRAATTWTITITAVGANPLSYSVSPTSGGCPYQDAQNAAYLYICRGDSVEWKAITTGADTTKMFSKLTIFQEDFILLDKDSDPNEGFQASNANVTEGGKTDPTAALYVEHKYHVSVYDKVTKIKYHDDPKIIIGGVNLEGLFDEIQSVCAQFPKAIDQDISVDDEARKKAKKQASELCQQFQNLKKPLN